MTTATLTPRANQTPALAKVSRELSGEIWVSRFRASKNTDDLTPQFKSCVDLFIAAIEAGGGKVDIANTYRPKERAYLMHWAHKIFRNGFPPAEVPAMAGVAIQWVHPTLSQSIAAAEEMVLKFRIDNLAEDTPPALNTKHTAREAIDMSITWTGNLELKKRDGTIETIDTLPRTGMNLQLKHVGKTYGVIKFVGGARDKPHWSTTGH